MSTIPGDRYSWRPLFLATVRFATITLTRAPRFRFPMLLNAEPHVRSPHDFPPRGRIN
ncbi:hypothetical protein ACQ4M4_09115 [Leptolyngbya sp. AN02str]|uniref:hypothetical protein n=1 Tax=Leptolyngbya sp. AN02str TaxID=3423363 RepID=UPI003D3134BC